MELKDLMKNAGIVGAGGAGFPSFAKLADGADTLVINGAECEPLLYTDYIIMKNEMDAVVGGVCAILDYAKIPRALICMKAHTAKRLALNEGDKLASRVYVKVLPDVYPMGDEISLIYQATGRVVRPGNLPITAGVIVYNTETMYNVHMALTQGKPLTEKWVTIGGNVKQPIVVRVPIGISVAELFKKYDIRVAENEVVLDGGPSMGKMINPDTATVTKTSKGFLILPNDIPAIQTKLISPDKAAARASTACCQCTRCTDMCPRHLLGYPLEPHKMVRASVHLADITPDLVKTATLCCACGICETLACCQGISPKAVINNFKGILAKNKIRYVANVDVEPAEEREYRMLPSDRWMAVLGVSKYDKVGEYVGEDYSFKKVTIMMSAHIGAPSVPAVSAGDRVNIGDVVAECGNGLSLPQHASVNGKVLSVDDKKIVIGRVD